MRWGLSDGKMNVRSFHVVESGLEWKWDLSSSLGSICHWISDLFSLTLKVLFIKQETGWFFFFFWLAISVKEFHFQCHFLGSGPYLLQLDYSIYVLDISYSIFHIPVRCLSQTQIWSFRYSVCNSAMASNFLQNELDFLCVAFKALSNWVLFTSPASLLFIPHDISILTSCPSTQMMKICKIDWFCSGPTIYFDAYIFILAITPERSFLPHHLHWVFFL